MANRGRRVFSLASRAARAQGTEMRIARTLLPVMMVMSGIGIGIGIGSTAHANAYVEPEPAPVDGTADRPTMAGQVALGAFLAIGGGVFGGYVGRAMAGCGGGVCGSNEEDMVIAGGAYTGASLGFALGINLAGDEGLQQNAFFGAAAGSFLGGATGLVLAIGLDRLATDSDGILGVGAGLVLSGWVAGGLVGYYAVRERSHTPIVQPTLHVDSHTTSFGLAGSF